jgi:hypothetical protein
MTKENQLAAPKLALRGLDVELLQDFKNILKMLLKGRDIAE